MNSLKTKLTIFQGLTGLLGIVLVFAITWFGAQQRIVSDAVIEADNLSDQIGYSISIITSQGGDSVFNYQRLIEKTATLHEIISIKVVDKEGVILADNNQKLIGQKLESPLITSAIENQRKEQQFIGQTLVVVRPLRGQSYTTILNDIDGFLWLELDLAPTYARTQKDILEVLLVSIGGFVMVFFWYYQITQRSILNRLSILYSGLSSVEQGDLTQVISVGKIFGSKDEINSLADQFNKMTASLQQKKTYDELTAYLAAKFMNVPISEMNKAIQDALLRLGELFEVDRTYIFEFANNGETMNNTYEWCAENIDPQIDNLQDLPTSIFPWWMTFLKRGETIIIGHVADMPSEASAEHEILAEQGIKSVLVMPMVTHFGLFGFLGFDSVVHERNWTTEESNLLTVLAGIITNTIIRRNSQQELIDQRDFALQIMNTVRQGLTVTNEQGLFEYVNPAYADMVKHTSAHLIGKPPLEFTHPDERPAQIEEFNKRRTGQVSSYLSRLLASDGTITNVLISATPRVRGGEICGSIAAITNLTDQLLVEKKLLQSEARNQAFLNAVPDLIFRIDKNGMFLDYKAGDNKQFYMPQEKILGASVMDVLPPDIGRTTISAIEKSLQTHLPEIFEYKLQTKDGLFTYEARIVASAQDEVIAVIHDISARARLEQMKTDFINRASHELRTPLTTALLMVDLLDRPDLEQNEREDYWKILVQELNRERLILEDVLTAGRIESGRYRVSGGSVSILPTLNDAINTMQAQADLRKIKIHVEVSGSIPNLRGAEEAFARIFNNLISNAVKFSKPKSEIFVRAYRKDNEIFIEVQDCGVGIPPEDLPHITSRFFRGTNATEQEIPGSGIGLYIIKNIVEELGGKLTIQSELDQGTTVAVHFPVVKEE